MPALLDKLTGALTSASATYETYKTPFYKIFITSGASNTFVELPHQVARLVQSVEITEADASFGPYGSQPFSNAKIVFTEGSREPFSPEGNVKSSTVYRGAQVTNQTGLVNDLQFTGSLSALDFLDVDLSVEGLTDLASELAGGLVGSIVSAIGIPLPIDKVLGELDVTKKPGYLLNEKNRVKIRWGYLSDQGKEILSREVVFFIGAISTTYPENGQVTTTIDLLPPTAIADMQAPTEAVTFASPAITGIDITTFQPLIQSKDKSITDVIKEIGKKAGFEVIVSENFEASVLKNDETKVWSAGETFHQFLIKYARKYNAFYDVFINPKTGKEVIVFIQRRDVSSKLLDFIPDYLFKYRGPNSILKSVDVKTTFNVPTGNTVKGTDNEGKVIEITAASGNKDEVILAEEKRIDSTPDKGNVTSTGKGIVKASGNKKFAGNVQTTPQTNVADLEANTASSEDIPTFVTFNAIGHPLVYPPLGMQLTGLGVRNSGFHIITQVTHTINSSGYNMSGSLIRYGIGGVYGAAGTNQTKAQVKPASVASQLAEPIPELPAGLGASLGANSSKANEYTKKKGGK